MKIYVPARDLEGSKRFYADMGFTLTESWDGNVHVGLEPAVFRLQDPYVEDWARNFIIQEGAEPLLR
jgi:hypothetical protein